MGTFTVGGRAKERGLSNVDPRLVAILRQTAAQSPYNVELFSASRPGDRRYHGRGIATDIVLSDPITGQEVPNLKSSVGFPIYEQFAKVARTVQQETYPELNGNFRWGGYFSGGGKKYGAVDLMHFDLGPTKKMAGGSWENGLTPEQARIIANMGPGQVYSAQGQYAADAGQYANLWGNAPVTAPQTAQSAIASLTAPGGGTEAPTPPSALQGFAPTIPDAAFGTPAPAQAAIADVFGFPPPPPANAFAPTVPDAVSRPPQRGPGPGGALGVDLGLQPAGMPVPPSRPGSFNWLGGGAPDAGLVPTPGISPLRPAMGGPGDRRPQPPLPTQRPALGIPDPRMRPSALQSLVAGRPEYPGRMPAAPFISPVRGRQEVPGALPAAGTPWNPLSSARMDLPQTDPRTVPSDLTPELLDRVRQLQGIGPYPARPGFPAPNINTAWSDPSRAFDIPPPLSRMADAPPPVRPTITPDFDFATAPGPTFTPPSLTPDIRGRQEFPGSMPPAPPPLATTADDPYRQQQMSSFDASRPYSGFTLPPQTAAATPAPAARGIEDVFGPTPAAAAVPNLAIPYNQVPGYDPSLFDPRPIESNSDISLTTTPPVTPMMMPQGDPWASAYGVPPIPDIPGSTIWEGGVAPTEGTEPVSSQPQAVDPAAAAANQPNIPQPPAVAAAAPQDPQAVQQEEQGRRGWLGRLLGIGQGGGPGGFRSLPGFGGILNPNGFLNNMGTPPAFTPFGDPRMSTGFGGSLRTSGTSPSGTNWQRGTSTAFGGGNKVSGPTQALSWQGSNGQTITAHTDPFTGQTFHSFSGP